MKKYIGEIGLFMIAIIWGSGFIGTKLALDGGLTPIQVLTLRFLVAATILGFTFFKKIKNTISKESIRAGILLGIFLFIGFSAQTFGLSYTTVSKNAFISSTNVIIVPFIGCFLYKRKLDKFGVFSSLLALLGIGILSIEGDFSLNKGDILTLLGAVGFAFHIFMTGEFSKKYNSYVLTVTQFSVAFILSLALQVMNNQIRLQGNIISYIGCLYLGIFSTAIGFLIQTICQSKVDGIRAAIILSTEAVFGSIMSVFIFKEIITFRMVIACMVIFSAIIIAETKLSFLNRNSIKNELDILVEDIIHIRDELKDDYDTVELLIKKAFKHVEHSDNNEDCLVNRLRKSKNFIHELSLVAEVDGEIVGHCLLTIPKIDSSYTEILALVPVSILPKFQGMGIGSKLIEVAIDKAKERDFSSIVVLGYDKHHPGFGFIKPTEFEISASFEVIDESCMVLELKEDSLTEDIIVYVQELLNKR